MVESLLMKLAGTLAASSLPNTRQLVGQVKKAASTGKPKDLVPQPNYTLLALAGVALLASFWVASRGNNRES